MSRIYIGRHGVTTSALLTGYFRHTYEQLLLRFELCHFLHLQFLLLHDNLLYILLCTGDMQLYCIWIIVRKICIIRWHSCKTFATPTAATRRGRGTTTTKKMVVYIIIFEYSSLYRYVRSYLLSIGNECNSKH
jgi:ABC-type dipeptide/oligopeptide/nickel transport system permease subunit